jgi:hypothetical protein
MPTTTTAPTPAHEQPWPLADFRELNRERDALLELDRPTRAQKGRATRLAKSIAKMRAEMLERPVTDLACATLVARVLADMMGEPSESKRPHGEDAKAARALADGLGKMWAAKRADEAAKARLSEELELAVQVMGAARAPGKRERAVLRIVRTHFGRERARKRQQRQAGCRASAAR